MAAGSVALSVLPAMWGPAAYIAAIAVLTHGYQLVQAANNTAVMMDVPSDGQPRGRCHGMRIAFAVTTALIVGAVVISTASRAFPTRTSPSADVS